MDYHESWNTPDFDHDICIVTLKEPLNMDDPNVAPIDFFKLDDGEIPAETVCNRWHSPPIGNCFVFRKEFHIEFDVLIG